MEKITKTAFSKEQQDNLYCLEDQSWWFRYRSTVIIKLLDVYFDKEKMTLDIGGGNGYTTLQAMKSGYRVGLIEPSAEACRHAMERGIPHICCGAVDECNMADSSIEQIMLLDVLEHIEDDKAFLKLLCHKAVKGGYLLITVPAYMCLWSSEDSAAGHFRRYKITQIEALAKAAGFEVIYSSYFMEFLFLPILCIRVGLEKLGFLKKYEERTEKEKASIAQRQFKSTNKVVNGVLGFLQSRELKLLQSHGRVKFGSSIVLVLRKGHGEDSL